MASKPKPSPAAPRQKANGTLRKEPAVEDLQQFFALSRDMLCIASADGYFQQVNPAFVANLGWSQEELLGRPFMSFVHPDDVAATGAIIGQLAQGQPITHFENRFLTNSGGHRWLEWNATPTADGRMYAIARDITDQIELKSDTRLSQERYRALLDTIEEGYYEVDLSGNLLFCNKRMAEIFGYEVSELLGMSNRDFTDPAALDEVYREFNHVFRTGSTTKGFIWPGIRKDGTRRYIETSTSLIHDEAGNPRGFRGIGRDVTERIRGEAQLRETEDLYRQAIAVAGAVAYALDYPSDSYAFMGDGIEAITGYTAAEMTPALWRSILVETEMRQDAAGLSEEEAQNLARAGQLPRWQADHLIHMASGEMRWVTDTAVMIQDDQGQPARSIGILLDITDRKEAEARLAQQADELNALTRRLTREGWESYLAGSDDMVFGYDQSAVRTGLQPAPAGVQTITHPLTIQGATFGQLALTDPEAFPDDINDIIDAVAQQLSGHLENLRLTEQNERTLSRTQTLYEIGRSLLETRDLGSLLNTVVEGAVNALHADRVTLITLDLENKTILDFRAGGKGAGSVVTVSFDELQSGLSGWVLRELQPAISPKDQPDPRETPEVQARRVATNCGAIIVVPLRYRDITLGTMTAINRPDQRDFTPEDAELLVALANQAAIAIDNQKLIVQTQQQLSDLTLLQEATSRLTTTTSLQETANALLPIITQATQTNMASLFRLVDESNAVRLATYPHNGSTPLQVGATLNLRDYPVTQEVLETRKPVITNIDDEKLTDIARQGFEVAGIQTNVNFPIVLRQGEVWGVLAVSATTPGFRFSERALSLLQTMANQAGVAFERAEFLEQMQVALAESETLYTTSARLTRAKNIAEVLQALVSTTALRHLELASISFFDHPWINQPPAAINVAATWIRGQDAWSNPEGQRFDFNQFGPLTDLNLEEPVVFHDVLADPRLDSTAREKLRSILGARSLAIFPLRAGGQWLGLLTAQSGQPLQMSDEEIRQITTLTGQATNVIQNLRLVDETRLRAEELAALNKMATTLASDLSVDAIIHAIFDHLALLMDANDAYVALYNEVEDEVDVRIKGPNELVTESALKRRGGNGVTEYVIRTGKPLLIRDNGPAVAAELGFEVIGRGSRSWLGVPMTIGNRTLGVVAVQSFTQPFLYAEHEQELLTAVANQAAITLQNAHLFEQTKAALTYTADQARRLTRLNQLADELSRATEQDSIFDLAVRQIQSMMEADRVSFGIITELGDDYQVMALAGLPGRVDIGTFRQIRGTPLATTIRQNEVLIQPDNQDEELPEIRSHITTPIYLGNRPFGVLGIYSCLPNAYDPRDESLVLQIASIMTATLENRRLFSEIQDALTEAQMLYEVSTRLNSAVTPAETLEAAIIPAAATGANRAVLWTLEMDDRQQPHWQEIVARWGSDDMTIDPHNTRFLVADHPLARVWLNPQREPVFIQDVDQDERVDQASYPILARMGVKATVSMPLTIGPRWVGLLTVSWPKTIEFTTADQRLYGSIAAQTAEVMEGRLLLQATRERATQLETLSRIEADLSQAENEADILQAIVSNFDDIPAATLSYIDLGNGNRPEYLRPTARWENRTTELLHQERIQVHEDPLATLWSTYPHDILVLEDITNDQRLTADQLAHLQAAGIGALAFIPLHTRGQWQGILQMSWPAAISLPATQQFIFRRLLESLAAIVAGRRAQLEQQAALSETANLYQAIAALNAAQTYDQILSVLRRYTEIGRSATVVSLIQFDRPWTESQRPEWLSVQARWSARPGDTLAPRYRLSEWPILQQATQDTPLVVEDVTQDPRINEPTRAAIMALLGARSMVFVPLVYAGQWVGFVTMLYDTPTSLSEELLRQLLGLTGQSAVAIQSIQLLQEAQARAHREQILREVTAKVRSSTDMEAIMQTAARELGQALGRKTFVYLGDTQPAGANVAEVPHE